jgi:hypothetical protein
MKIAAIVEFFSFVFSLICTGITFLFNYFSLVEWFVLSVLLMISQLSALLTNGLASWMDFPNQILLFIVLIPLFELIASINITIFFGFFQQFRFSINRESLVRFMTVHWTTGSFISRLYVIAVFMIEFGLVIISFLALILRSESLVPNKIIVYGCIVIPFLSLLRVLALSWTPLFSSPSPEFSAFSLSPVETEKTVSLPSPAITPLDAIGLLSSTEWLGFIRSPTNVIRLVRLRRFSLRLIPAGLMLIGWVSLMVMDVIRHVRFESYNTEVPGLQDYLKIASAEMCGDYCAIMCPYQYSGVNCTIFCADNCSHPTNFSYSQPDINIVEQRVLFAIRLLFFIFALPFIVSAAPFAVDFATAKKCELSIIKIFGLLLSLFGLFAVVIGLILSRAIHPRKIPRMDREPNANISFVGPPAPMCKGGIDDWDLIQLSGMSIVAEFMHDLPALSDDAKAQLCLFLDTIGIWQSLIVMPLFNGYLRLPNFMKKAPEMNKPWRVAVAFPGTGDRFDLAFMLENVIPLLVSTALSSVIPFYNIARRYFFNTVETDVEQTLQLAIGGPRRLSLEYWMAAITMTRTIHNMFETDIWYQQYVFNWTNQSSVEMSVYVGQGSYGMLAKGMAGQVLRSGFAFQSPQFTHSPLSVFQEWDRRWADGAASRLLDLRSASSLQAFYDSSDYASSSLVLPSLDSGFTGFFKTPEVTEVFCMIAAGCATTSQYDNLCGQLLGSKDKFYEMFALWNRNRTAAPISQSN